MRDGRGRPALLSVGNLALPAAAPRTPLQAVTNTSPHSPGVENALVRPYTPMATPAAVTGLHARRGAAPALAPVTPATQLAALTLTPRPAVAPGARTPAAATRRPAGIRGY